MNKQTLCLPPGENIRLRDFDADYTGRLKDKKHAQDELDGNVAALSDLGYRLYRAGHRIFLARHLQATHAKAYTLGSLWRSELFGRAVPWTRLMIEYRIFRNDLNTRVSSVFSVLTACALPVSVLIDPRLRLAGALALLFLWSNRAFLRLSAREYGFFFAVRSAGLCWLSCLASALGACLGAGAWLWEACCSGAGKLLALARDS